MEQFPKNSVCVVGLSRTETVNPITQKYNLLIISFIANPLSGEILNLEMNAVCSLTNRFLHDLLVGSSLFTDMDKMVEQLQNRYLGKSRKAIIVALKDACGKLQPGK